MKKLEEEIIKTGFRYLDNEDGTYDVCYDHAQDPYFSPIIRGHRVATIREDERLWYISNEGDTEGEYLKSDWTLKEAIIDQCVDF